MMQAETGALSGHGGRIDDAARLFPHAPQPWLDLSTGINPVAWQPPAGLAIDLAPLPTRAALRDLEAAAAACFGIDAAHVAAVPGSEIALRLLPALGLPGPWRFVAPSYGTHAAVAERAIRPDALADEAAHGGTILLANPNNPDGRLLPPADLLHIADRLAASHGWLVIDEAFADALPDASLLPHLGARANVVVLRSFGKYFGLAGLRLGFLIAPPAIIAHLRAHLGDWPVSTPALAYGTAAYRDTAWIAATRTRIAAEASALDALLARHGLEAAGACPLFRLVRTPAAPALFERLARAGILTRPFADRPTWLRFGLPADVAACARLEQALAHG